MKKDVVIKVENLSKKYVIGAQQKHFTLRDKVGDFLSNPLKSRSRNKKEDFWALKNVSFEVNRGEVVGIIGKNGSGKSTLLKILSRIAEPTKGSATLKGRVASLLEVGTGFNPELTGRENVYLNGAILGMSRKEVESKFDEIVAFSGVKKFIDTPVKRYSSGMYVRLAFAVAAHLDSDVLLVDEVLAVGDSEFQKKCLGKMRDLAGSGKTVIFVSHNMGAIQQLCNKGFVLTDGKSSKISSTSQAVDLYFKKQIADIKKNSIKITSKSGIIEFTKFKLNKKSVGTKNEVFAGENINIDFNYSSRKYPFDLAIGFGIRNKLDHNLVIFITNYHEKYMHDSKKKGKVSVSIEVPHLSPGEYHLEMQAWLDSRLVVTESVVTNFFIAPVPFFRNNETFNHYPSTVLVKSDWAFE